MEFGFDRVGGVEKGQLQGGCGRSRKTALAALDQQPAGVVIGIQEPDPGEQVADGLSLDQRGFARSVGTGDDPEFKAGHGTRRSGLAQSSPFDAVKVLAESGREFRGAVVLVLRRGPLDAGAGENGLQPRHQFLFLAGREPLDGFENFNNRAHGGKRAAPPCGAQTELRPNWRRPAWWRRTGLPRDSYEAAAGGDRPRPGIDPRATRGFCTVAAQRGGAAAQAERGVYAASPFERRRGSDPARTSHAEAA